MLKRLDQEEEEVEALSESDLLELEQKEEERLSRSLEAGGQSSPPFGAAVSVEAVPAKSPGTG